jgi:hypothetical protein
MSQRVPIGKGSSSLYIRAAFAMIPNAVRCSVSPVPRSIFDAGDYSVSYSLRPVSCPGYQLELPLKAHHTPFKLAGLTIRASHLWAPEDEVA